MNIQQKIEQINQKENQLRIDRLSVKTEFIAFIQDKNIPLVERWKTFINAPDDLSDQLDSFPSFHYEELGLGLDYFMDNLLVEEHVNQYSNGCNTLNMKSIISNYYDEEKNKISTKLVRYSLEQNSEKISDEKLSVYIWQLMEDVLQLNLCSFEFDS